MKKLLFLTSELPFPENSGAKVRDASLIRLLKEKFQVHVIYTEPTATTGIGDAAFPDVLASCLPRERLPWYRKLLQPLRSYVRNGFNKKVADFLAQNQAEGAVLWISRLALAQYLPIGKAFGYQVVLDEHNVESGLYFELLKQSRFRIHPLETWRALQLYHWEKRYCRMADQVVVTSEHDREKLRTLSGRDSLVIPNLINAEKFRAGAPSERSKELLFVGTLDYEPNKQGLFWFLEHVWPRCRAPLASQGWNIHIVGTRAPQVLRRALQDAGIKLSENVPSVAPYLESAGLIFVPLLSGSGTRLKILEACAAGIPAISTSKGAEGIAELSHGKNIWLADGAAKFSEGLISLIANENLRKRLGESARALALQRFDWRAGRDVLQNFLDKA
jgi:glycosyltransferase involved in cell wall biosynthesis